jgi:hypothetical protein
MAQFRKVLDERRYHDAVVAEAAAAEAFGVDGTPTMFINGQPIVGSREQDDIDRVVDAHLGAAKAVVAKGLDAREIYPMVMTMAEGLDRADPGSVPASTSVHIELRSDDRARTIEAACRRRDPARARQLVNGFQGEGRAQAVSVCAGEGIDL